MLSNYLILAILIFIMIVNMVDFKNYKCNNPEESGYIIKKTYRPGNKRRSQIVRSELIFVIVSFFLIIGGLRYSVRALYTGIGIINTVISAILVIIGCIILIGASDEYVNLIENICKEPVNDKVSRNKGFKIFAICLIILEILTFAFMARTKIN